MKSDGVLDSIARADDDVVVSKAGREAEKTEADELMRCCQLSRGTITYLMGANDSRTSDEASSSRETVRH